MARERTSTVPFSLRLERKEKADVQRVARRAGIPAATWARLTLVERARCEGAPVALSRFRDDPKPAA